jgi:AI-2 transport protein TqsA
LNSNTHKPDLGQAGRFAQTLIVLASLVIVVAGLKAAAAIMVPLLMAIFLAIIASAPLRWLQDRGLPLWASISVVFIVLVLTLMVIGSLIGASVNQITTALPRYEQQLTDMVDQAVNWLGSLGIQIPAGGVIDLINPGAAAQFFGRLVSGFGGLLANSMLIIFTVLFIMVETSTLPAKLFSILKQPEETLASLDRFMQGVARYLVIKAVMSFITGTLIAIYLLLLGVDFAFLWGALAFFMNFVPYIGSILAAVPAVVLALLDADVTTATAVAGGFLATNMLVGNVLEPKFTGRGLGQSTLVVFLSLIFWGWVFGPVGMLLSTPLTMLMMIALENDPRTRWISILLSDQAPANSKTAHN